MRKLWKPALFVGAVVLVLVMLSNGKTDYSGSGAGLTVNVHKACSKDHLSLEMQVSSRDGVTHTFQVLKNGASVKTGDVGVTGIVSFTIDAGKGADAPILVKVDLTKGSATAFDKTIPKC